jgi:hypothetical protein
MRYLLVAGVFIASVMITKAATDVFCIDESDAEVCDSMGVECGVIVRLRVCGEKRQVMCVCADDQKCSMSSLQCI